MCGDEHSVSPVENLDFARLVGTTVIEASDVFYVDVIVEVKIEMAGLLASYLIPSRAGVERVSFEKTWKDTSTVLWLGQGCWE